MTRYSASAILSLIKHKKRLRKTKMKNHQRTLYRALSVVVLAVTLVAQVFPASNVYATQITNRSLTLQAGAVDGGAKPGGVVTHDFKFRLPSACNYWINKI